MPMLCCRRCGSDITSIERVDTYRRKRIATICCTNCGNQWYISIPINYDVYEWLHRDNISVAHVQSSDSAKLQTAVAAAYQKALEKKNTKK